MFQLLINVTQICLLEHSMIAPIILEVHMIAVHWVLLAQSETENEISHIKHQLVTVAIVLELQAVQDLDPSVPVQLVNRQVSICQGYVLLESLSILEMMVL